MPRVLMMPLQKLQGDYVAQAKRSVKENGDLHLQSTMMEYSPEGEGKTLPTILLGEYDEVAGMEGVDFDTFYVLLKVAFALDLGMVRVRRLPLARGRL